MSFNQNDISFNSAIKEIYETIEILARELKTNSFTMEELTVILRGLIREYQPVVNRSFIKYLKDERGYLVKLVRVSTEGLFGNRYEIARLRFGLEKLKAFLYCLFSKQKLQYPATLCDGLIVTQLSNGEYRYAFKLKES